ncbi:hypothetical protein ACOMHN_012817 [Nucella lapillus]
MTDVGLVLALITVPSLAFVEVMGGTLADGCDGSENCLPLAGVARSVSANIDVPRWVMRPTMTLFLAKTVPNLFPGSCEGTSRLCARDTGGSCVARCKQHTGFGRDS